MNSKLKLVLKEDDELEEINKDVTEEQDTIPEDIVTDEEDLDVTPEYDEEKSFIDSDDLNSIREILLDIPDDIELLLLDDKVVVLGIVNDGKTFLYSLQEDNDNFVLVEMPLKLDEIMNDNSIIKYTEEGSDSRHEQVYGILMKRLNPEDSNEVEEPKEDITEEEPTEEDDENDKED